MLLSRRLKVNYVQGFSGKDLNFSVKRLFIGILILRNTLLTSLSVLTLFITTFFYKTFVLKERSFSEVLIHK